MKQLRVKCMSRSYEGEPYDDRFGYFIAPTVIPESGSYMSRQGAIILHDDGTFKTWELSNLIAVDVDKDREDG